MTYKVYILFIFIILIGFNCSSKDVTIEGTVYRDLNDNKKYDAAINEPVISGADIRSGNQVTASGPDGKFILKGEVVEAGTLYLFVSKEPKYVSQKVAVHVLDNKDAGILTPDAPVNILMQTN